MRKIVLLFALSLTLWAAKAQEPMVNDPYLNEVSRDTLVLESQDKYKVETNYFWDNWFINAGIGAQIQFADHNRQMQLKDRFTMALDLSTGKWFSPGLGVRAGVSGYQLKGLSGWSEHSATEAPNYNRDNYTGFIKNAYQMYKEDGSHFHWAGDVYKNTKIPDHYTMYKTEIFYLNTQVDALFNLTNILFGFKKDRVFEFIPYIGVGWAHTFNRGIYENRFGDNVMGKRSNEVTANVGFLNLFNISDAFAISVDIRGTYMNDRFDQQIGGRYGEGIASGTIGLTYNFNQRGWNKGKTMIIKYGEKDINMLRDRINELQAANIALQNQLGEPRVQEQVKETVLAGPLLVTFVINKYDLSNEARVNLGFLADAIKKNPQSTFVITGYADEGTGNVSINDRLSKNRAKAVYDCLVNEFGVNPSQIRAEYEGGVKNMYYNDPRLSRAVITRVE